MVEAITADIDNGCEGNLYLDVRRRDAGEAGQELGLA